MLGLVVENITCTTVHSFTDTTHQDNWNSSSLILKPSTTSPLTGLSPSSLLITEFYDISWTHFRRTVHACGYLNSEHHWHGISLQRYIKKRFTSLILITKVTIALRKFGIRNPIIIDNLRMNSDFEQRLHKDDPPSSLPNIVSMRTTNSFTSRSPKVQTSPVAI